MPAPLPPTPDCHFALVIPTTLGNLSYIADAIVKSTQLSAKLLSPLPAAAVWSPVAASRPASANASSGANATIFFGGDFDLFGVPFPSSGHTWLHIILTTLVAVAIMIVIIFGNSLVIVAVQADKSLKGIQNLFIVSLAAADLLVGLAIMPLSLAVELMGKWIFGHIVCNLWLGGDVLLCTASILNLCMISIDRYWSVTLAGQYTARVRKRRVTIMIVLVWILSTVISLPPIVGWAQKFSGDEECELMDDVWYIIYSTCGSFYLPLVVMIVVYIRIFAIARRTARKSAFTLTKQLKKKRTKLQPTAAELKVALSAVNNYNKNDTQNSQPAVKYGDSLTVDNLPVDSPLSLRSTNNNNTTANDNGAIDGNLSVFVSNQPQRLESVTRKEAPSTGKQRFRRLLRRLLLAKYFTRRQTSLGNRDPVGFSLIAAQRQESYAQSRPSTPQSKKQPSSFKSNSLVTIDERDDVSTRSARSSAFYDRAIHQASTMLSNVAMRLAVVPRVSHLSRTSASTISELPPLPESMAEQAFAATFADKSASQLAVVAPVADSDQRHGSSPTPPELPKAGLNGCDNNNRTGNGSSSPNNGQPSPTLKHFAESEKSVPPLSLADEVERRKKRLAKERERRTTRILVIIMLSFIGCWFPFFTLYLVSSLAGFNVNRFVFATFFWLGYFNSALNPVTYAAFNEDFRAAFKRLLRIK